MIAKSTIPLKLSFFLLAALSIILSSSSPVAARHYSPESTATAGDPITLGLLSLSDDPYTLPINNNKDHILLSESYTERGIVIGEGTPLEVTAGIAVHEQRYYTPHNHHHHRGGVDGLSSSSLSTVTDVSVFATVNTLVLIALVAICVVMAIRAYVSLGDDDDDDDDVEKCEQFQKGYAKLSNGGDDDDMMRIKTARAA